jgi:hypothetical protein
MGQTGTPSIVPSGIDEAVYLVLDCFGRGGCVWREADAQQTDLENVIADLMAGQYSDPLRVVAMNTVEGWARDVSADVASEIRRRADLANEDISSSLEEFVSHHAAPRRHLARRRM